eukprot:Plantae.Rhodophyta-Rhodochaete_pulchella.ctg12902.p1 GENE.Plantae.Rhodophyta-Rhodochaete_pulchella.ctg12902~~Plantae.Rhodophyta-Rhodochaete_pulchella.ctg12902.p1  ORF type:complete len:397 (-),score=26.20 Plantae.Rhodophyta-Rhodochaete_pulchella.ctg12902:744-1817(-)
MTSQQVEDYLQATGFRTAGQQTTVSPTDSSSEVSRPLTYNSPEKETLVPSVELPDLSDEQCLLSINDCLTFERNGHIIVRNICQSPEISPYIPWFRRVHRERVLDAYQQACTVLLGTPSQQLPKSVTEAQSMLREFEQDGRFPFLQHFNLRRAAPEVAKFILARRFARVAADLLGVNRVRLYQDSLFAKRPGDGPTNWHADLNMAPIDTNKFVSMWLPLSFVPEAGSGLVFATGSHRDFSLAFWRGREAIRTEDLSYRYEEETYGAMRVGDASFHHGWCLHAADGVSPSAAHGRMALSISYFADEGSGTRAATKMLPKSLVNEIDPEDRRSFEGWIKEVKRGRPLRHREMPVVYERH